MSSVLFRRRDPWWDLEGRGARRTRLRQRIVALTAFVLSVGACGLTTAVWIRELTPLVARLLG